jgi:hypothetical protein
MKCDSSSGSDGGSDNLTIWPNSQSRAMSDPWLVAHHDELREMRPHVLVLNFDNGSTTAQVETFAHDRVFPGIRRLRRPERAGVSIANPGRDRRSHRPGSIVR